MRPSATRWIEQVHKAAATVAAWPKWKREALVRQVNAHKESLSYRSPIERAKDDLHEALHHLEFPEHVVDDEQLRVALAVVEQAATELRTERMLRKGYRDAHP